MIIRNIKDIAGTDREVEDTNWRSRRLLLQQDRMGFSLHDTTLHAGTQTRMWYQNHVEAVYCIEGEGEIEDLDRETVHPIHPGTMYALDQHDRHVLRAHTALRMICVFNPPLVGPETHDENGVYPLLAKVGQE
jgi:L-ectoine synthase